MDTNFELYKVFFYIAKEGSITQAADKLFISQPAVTQSLKKLEEELGGPLFIRKKSGVILTPEGQKLFEYIENSIYTLNNAKNLFSQYLNSDIGKVRVNTAGAWGFFLMPEILKNYHEKYPNVEVSVSIYKTSDAVQKLLKSDLDICIFEGDISEYKDQLEVKEITKIKYGFYTSKEYLEKVGPIDKNHLEKYEFLLPNAETNQMRMLKEKLDKAGVVINSNRYIAGAEITKNMVKNGLGIGFFNEVHVIDNLDFVKVDIGIEDVEGILSIVVKNQKLLSSAALHLLKIMEEIIRRKN